MIKHALILYLEKIKGYFLYQKITFRNIWYRYCILFIVSVYVSYQTACRTECIIWSSGSNHLKYFGFWCDWYSNYILLKFYLMCPYCLTKIGFNRKHLEKTLEMFTVEKAGLTLLGGTKSIAENEWQRLWQPLWQLLMAKIYPFPKRNTVLFYSWTWVFWIPW